MAEPPPQVVGQNGYLVALEGPADIVSTQLRLLPTSRQILVLPDIQHYLPKESKDEEPFSPRRYIQRIYKAFEARHTEAQDFLRQSTTEEGRFVFTNGGTIGAQAQCVSAISEYVTGGDLDEADALFNSLVSNGLAGLSTETKQSVNHNASIFTWEEKVVELKPTALRPRPSRQPRQTEWNPRKGAIDSPLDISDNPIIRAMRAAEALDKETEFLQPVNHDVDLTVGLVEIKKANTVRSLSLSVVESVKGFSSPSTLSALSGLSGVEAPSYESGPPLLVTKESVEEQPPKIPPRKRPLRIHIPTPSLSWKGKAEVSGDEQISPTAKSFLPPAFKSMGEKRPWTAETYAPSTREQCGGWKLQQRIHQNTTVNWGMFEKWGDRTEPEPRFDPEPIQTPVLPLHEDLVIYLSAEEQDRISKFIFDNFCEGNYNKRVSDKSPARSKEMPSSSRKESDGHRDSVHGSSSWESSWSDGALVHGLPTPGSSPTPSKSQRGTVPWPEHGLHHLNVRKAAPINLQNSVRSLLRSCVSIRHGTGKALPSLKPSGAEILWAPLHCGADESKRIDMILAVGAEEGVKAQQMALVTEGIENLGRKRSGSSQSGRLKLRPLIASAMQAFTAQPLTRQCQSNPFSDRELLAALIIPHLDTYLHKHQDIRLLLIDYPAEHLGTVIAMQQLIGAESMKVVGILNSEGDGSSLIRPLTAPPRPESKKAAGARFQNEFGDKVLALMGACSFSRVNFLLASSASEYERAAFIAAIRESLISVSDFYMPELPLYKLPVNAVPEMGVGRWSTRRPTLSINRSVSTSHLSKSKTGTFASKLDTPPTSPADSYLAVGGLRSVAPGGRHSPPVPVGKWDRVPRIYKSNRITDRVRWADENYAVSPSHLNTSSRLAESVTMAGEFRRNRDEFYDDDDEEDEDEDERRLMPLYLQRQVERRESHKAMKVLGLSL
ncbi:hypothetical protein QBC43DRAFT_20522 [Cladorrhinum sp. PSN259]|nr:hypothetical protein QBC43DRAFT_20522 [Cladorrhinum sp. PSN259]